MSNSKNPLRLNVGFITQQPVGYSRDFEFDLPQIKLVPDLDLSSFSGLARITRTPQGLLSQVAVQATTPVACVRCLSDIQQPLHVNFTELFTFSSHKTTDNDLILPENGHIDFGPLAREYFILEIPISPLCKPDCKGLCPVCGENLNEVTCLHEDPEPDPRLAALRTLLEE